MTDRPDPQEIRSPGWKVQLKDDSPPIPRKQAFQESIPAETVGNGLSNVMILLGIIAESLAMGRGVAVSVSFL